MDYSSIDQGGFGDVEDQNAQNSRSRDPMANSAFADPAAGFTTKPSSSPLFQPVDDDTPIPDSLENSQHNSQTLDVQRTPSRPQPQQRTSSRQAPQSVPKQPRPHHTLQAKITGLERTGRKDPILRFDVHTNLPKFRTTQFRDVRRTHSEFIKFATHLQAANPECFVPAVPPPSTSAGVGTEEDEARLRGLMQRWLHYVCSNDVLIRDEEMIYFVESDFGYSPVMRKKQPATGVRRKMLKQLAPPHDETTELADARPVVKAFYLGTMEGAHKVDKVVKTRRALALGENDFGVKLIALADPALTAHAGLSHALRKLGKTIQAIGDQQAAHATSEATTFSDPLQYHSADSFIVKETLTNRQMLMRELETAKSTTRSRLSTTDRLKASSSIKKDKVDEAIQALDEARSHETHLQAKVNRVTSNLLLEQRKWFVRTVSDLRASIRDYTLRQIEAERRALATLESVRPDIRNIDASGGLSRLGRDVPPAARRASMASSQGPRGDAWSGVSRSQAAGLNRNTVAGNFTAPPGTTTTTIDGKVTEEREDEEDTQQRNSARGAATAEDTGDDDRVDAKNAASRLAASTFF